MCCWQLEELTKHGECQRWVERQIYFTTLCYFDPLRHIVRCIGAEENDTIHYFVIVVCGRPVCHWSVDICERAFEFDSIPLA